MRAAAQPIGRAQDASALRRQLGRVERRRKLQAVALTLPLIGFLLVFFVLPILGMLRLSVANDELVSTMPETARLLRDWQGEGMPPEEILAVVARELRAAHQERTLAKVGKRLNYERSGYRTLLLQTGRSLPERPQTLWRETFLAIDPEWGEPRLWAALRRAAAPWTDFYLLAALDLERDEHGGIRRADPERAIYLDILIRTFWIALLVTLACLVIGYPLAYSLAGLPEKHANLLLILVLLPFWTSLLVRSAAWIVLLQREGPVNDLLQWLGLIREPLQLVFNRAGVLIAMTHVLLPFMVLPLYSVMRTIHPSYVRAAVSLGATPFTAFRRIFLPLSLPGIAAGSLLVFILAIGYYITPALLGGASDQMISWFIAFFTLQTINWGMAAALGNVLLLATLALYALFARVVGVDRLRFG
jgi:putative spermidine/putrescine transport system permease protein